MRQRLIFPADFAPEDEGFVVTFPDLPEAITQGDDLDDALAMAADCLEEAIAGRINDGEDIPAPSPRAAGQRLIAVPAPTAAKAALFLALRETRVTRAELGRRIGTDHKEVRRMLDPRHPTKLPRIAEALAALGKRLVIEIQDAA